jgi:hypothetical protein
VITTREHTNQTWAEMLRDEPRLAQLAADARQVVDPGGDRFCRYTIWYHGDGDLPPLKQTLIDILSDYRLTPGGSVENSSAFRIAKKKILAQLPKCRMCDCVVPGDIFLRDMQRIDPVWAEEMLADGLHYS